MSTGGKILQFPNRIQGRESQKNSPSHDEAGGQGEDVVDIASQREEIIQGERRTVRRTILREFIGVHIVVPGRGLVRCTLADISEKGLAFDLEEPVGHLKKDEVVAMRIYMNHQTYFGFTVRVKGARFIEDEGLHRHGASFVEDTLNEEAIRHFALFIESVSASLRRDGGDVMVSNLKNG